MPDIGFVYDCAEESIQIEHHMTTRFLLSSQLSLQKNKPVMLSHDGFTSPHALPAIDFFGTSRSILHSKTKKVIMRRSIPKRHHPDLSQSRSKRQFGKVLSCTQNKNLCCKRNL